MSPKTCDLCDGVGAVVVCTDSAKTAMSVCPCQERHKNRSRVLARFDPGREPISMAQICSPWLSLVRTLVLSDSHWFSRRAPIWVGPGLVLLLVIFLVLPLVPAVSTGTSPESESPCPYGSSMIFDCWPVVTCSWPRRLHATYCACPLDMP